MSQYKLSAIFEADVGNFKKGISDVKKSLGDVGNEATNAEGKTKKGVGGIKSSLGGLAGIVAGAFAIGTIKDFAVSMIEAGAGSQAMAAQFEQVFGGLGGEAQKSVDTLGDTFGMVPNRIKPAFTQMTSMFKGLGYDTKEAMDMSTRGITLAADASAFYDKSLEETNSSLNSFLKGNYEGGESIGLFANETQMAAYASDELGMEWSKLDEAGKQLVRMQYAEAMMAASGATGQAAKESDSYQNQLGNVKQSWTDLKAQMAQPFVEPVVEGLKWLSEMLQNVDFGAIKEKFMGFIGLFTGYYSGIFAIWAENFNLIKPLIQNALSAIVTFVQEKLAMLKSFWDQNGTQIIQAVTNVWSVISAIFQAVLPVILAIVKFVWDSIKGVIDGALKIIMGLVKTFSGLLTGDFSGMWEGIKQLFSGAIQLIWNLMNLSFVGAIKKLAVSFVKTLVTGFKGLWDDIALRFMYGKDKVVSVFNTFKTSVSNVFNSVKTGLTNTANNIWNAIKTAFSNMSSSVGSIINTLKATASTVFNAIKTTITNAISTAKTTAVNTFDNLKSGATNAFNGIKSSASDIFNKVKSAITNPIETAKSTVLGIIDKIKNAFSNMKITIPKPKMPRVSVGMGYKNFMGADIPVPSFSVDWYKSGGIFKGSRQGSIVGLAEGGGDEAVLPLSDKSRMKPFAHAVASMMGDVESTNGNTNSNPVMIESLINIENFNGTKQEMDNAIDKAMEKLTMLGVRIVK